MSAPAQAPDPAHVIALVRACAHRHYPRGGGIDDYDDLVGAALLRIYRRLHAYDPDRGLFTSWVYQEARGAMSDHRRGWGWGPRGNNVFVDSLDREIGRAAGAEDLELADMVPDPVDQMADVDDDLDRDLNGDLVAHAIARLPRRQRMVLELRFWEGYTLAQIGAALEVTESRASQLVQAALAALRPLLADYADVL